MYPHHLISQNNQILPDRRSIIQIAEGPILQQPKNIIQPEAASKISAPESSQLYDKVIPVPDYIIPQRGSGDDSTSRAIKRKTIQDTSREIPAYADPIYRPSPKLTEIPLQEIPRKLMDLDTYQEGVISAMYQRPDRSYFQEPPEFKSLVITSKLVQKVLT